MTTDNTERDDMRYGGMGRISPHAWSTHTHIRWLLSVQQPDAYENGKSEANETEIGITQKYKKEARNTWGSSSGQCLIVDVKNWFT